MINEEKLLCALKRRKRKALESAIEIYMPYVSAVIFRVGGGALSKEDIEEAAADVFVALWKNADRISAEKGSLRSYIGGAARNTAYSFLRRRKDCAEYPPELEAEDNAQKSVLDGERSELLWQAVRSLGEPECEIFIRYYRYGERIREISAAMGLNSSTVKTKLARGRKKLKTILGKTEGLQ